MSYAVDAATKLHDRQVQTASQIQDLLVKVAGGFASLRDKAPETPERIAAPLEKVTAPLSKVVGSPAEVATYVSRSTRDWVELQQRFQDTLFELALAGRDSHATAEPEVKATVTKTSSKSRKS